DEARHEYGLDLVSEPATGAYSGVLLAVAHDEFAALGADGLRAFGSPNGHVLYDLKAQLPASAVDLRL
ncbi:Vi polysaccharide biosynthesis UDP-N-acetylglucosamine C-6 dehydrogenase TviB, partial [Aeromonas veronii]